MNNININSKNIISPISKDFYGCFFEDINWAGDGGLYGELLQNRSFEDGLIPDGCTYADGKFTTSTGFSMPFPQPDLVPCWICENGATISLDKKELLNISRKAAAKVEFVKNSTIINTGYDGICTNKGDHYQGFIFAKTSTPLVLTLTLGGGVTTITLDQSTYTKYDFTVIANTTGKSQLEITSNTPAIIYFGYSSLMPVNTYKNRPNGLRKDLAERIESLNPKFLRFPGGCIVEGLNRESIMHFKSTIGSVWERPTHYLLWGYRTTNGFGFDEFMNFCEDLNCKALYVVNCGLSCQGRSPYHMTRTEFDELCNEVLDMLEYSLGDTTTAMGALRASNGHPQPYPLEFLEIGNENYGSVYRENYKYMYDIVSKAYPQVKIIANEHREKCHLPCDIVDEHYYSDSDFFAMYSTMYDSYPKTSKIYVGEYAITRGTQSANLYTAAGEAAFLIGMERNQQIVKMTSYAPMFVNEAHCWWQPDLIRFTGNESRVIPLYHVLKLFSEKRGETVIGCDVSCEYTSKPLFKGIFGENCIVSKNGNNLPSAYTMDDEDCLEFVPTEDGRGGFYSNNNFNHDFEAYCLHFKRDTVQVMYWNGYSRVILTEPTKFKGKIQVITTPTGFKVTNYNIEILDYTPPKVPSLIATAAIQGNTVIIKGVNYSNEPAKIQFSTDFAQPAKSLCHKIISDGVVAQEVDITTGYTADAKEIFVLEFEMTTR